MNLDPAKIAEATEIRAKEIVAKRNQAHESWEIVQAENLKMRTIREEISHAAVADFAGYVVTKYPNVRYILMRVEGFNEFVELDELFDINGEALGDQDELIEKLEEYLEENYDYRDFQHLYDVKVDLYTKSLWVP